MCAPLPHLCCLPQTATIALLYNMGQCCAAGTRMYVHADIYDEFVQKYIAAFKAW
jgi:acyl-CoA reductase-like NAD-dependent aldehyde dehydrogenase